MEYLVEQSGTDILNQANQNGYSAILATFDGSPVENLRGTLEYILEKLPDNFVNDVDSTRHKNLLQLSTEGGKIDHMEILLMSGADQSLVPDKQGTMAHIHVG